jgi:hypothetical protein
LNWVVLLSLFVQSDLRNDSGSQLREYFGDAFSNIFTTFVGELKDLFLDALGFVDLSISEFLDALGVTSDAWVDESLLLHLDHERSMFGKMGAEMILEHEELFL